MLTKSNPEEIQSFLSDASNLAGGHAARILFPESAAQVAEALAEATRTRTPVTVSGAGTGLVGGRVPFGGIVVSTDRLKRIVEIQQTDEGGAATAATNETAEACVPAGRGTASAEAGVLLSDFQREVEARGLFYPPDPTERSCYLGATVATNSSGARSFKYGATRAYVRRLKVALATGELRDLRRGEIFADAEGVLRIPLARGREVVARLPSYRMPQTRKHAAGYYVAQGMDAIDLFIGSEGTLGVVVEIEATLLVKPEKVLSGIVFFRGDEELLGFVGEARTRSLQTRARTASLSAVAGVDRADETRAGGEIDARALEYFDAESLNFLREHYPLVPFHATGAIFFEQELTERTEEASLSSWLALLERHGALLDDSWFGTNEHDRAEMREFRHKLPVLVNEWLARHGQRKVSTDMAVPAEHFPSMLRFYRETLRASGLQFVIFGHIGDSHVHVNIMPRDALESVAARDIYMRFIQRAVSLGGTISAEHGVGKIKREYLRELYGDAHLREMAAVKRAFDPACILGRGNIFAEDLLQ